MIGFARSPFREFESYLRFVAHLDEEDIQLILKRCNSNLLEEYHLTFTQSKNFQGLFTPWAIMKELYKLDMLILA